MKIPQLIKDWWFQLLLIIGMFLLLVRGCSINGFFSGEQVVKKDTTTVYIKGTSDTIFIPTKKIVYKDRDFHHYHTDTIYNIDSTDYSIGYMYEKKDSVINALFGVWAKERPDSITFEYTANIPHIITTDTIINTITEKVRVNQLYLGPEAIVYPNFKGGFVTMDFIHNKGWQLEAGIGYGKTNNSTTLMGKVGFKKVISFRKRK